jgi:hypothetical protein
MTIAQDELKSTVPVPQKYNSTLHDDQHELNQEGRTQLHRNKDNTQNRECRAVQAWDEKQHPKLTCVIVPLFAQTFWTASRNRSSVVEQ